MNKGTTTKSHLQEKKKDEFGEHYARTTSSLLGDLRDMERLLSEHEYSCEDSKHILTDLNEVVKSAIKLTDGYKQVIEINDEQPHNSKFAISPPGKYL